jgi:uncharacterized Zn-binding protein involved in type VI secretion
MFLPGCNDVLAEGSKNVFVEGKPAARVGDRGSCGAFTLLGSSSVRINGKPAVRVGDQVQCANGRIGVIRDGASSVFVEGKPLATAASRIDGCE